LDALRVKIREEGFIRNKAVCIALGVQPDATADIFGHWIEQTEGARILTAGHERVGGAGGRRHPDRRHRRAERLPDAITAVFPQMVV
jgi:putative transposase